LKLGRLQSVANNAVRGSLWSHEPYGDDPFKHYDAPFEIVVDLVSGTLTPSMDGDSVEEYYVGISKWFHDVLVKEGIPVDVIESAIIKITPGGGKICVIRAEGRKFESWSKQSKKKHLND
jgi:hypothetical protein